MIVRLNRVAKYNMGTEHCTSAALDPYFGKGNVDPWTLDAETETLCNYFGTKLLISIVVKETFIFTFKKEAVGT